MKKYILLIFLTFFLSINISSQNLRITKSSNGIKSTYSRSPLIQVHNISFDKLSNATAIFYSDFETNFGNKAKILENQFNYLRNGWYWIGNGSESYLIKDKGKYFITNFNRGDGLVNILNDSLIVLPDGTIFNIDKDSFINTTLDNSNKLKVKCNRYSTNFITTLSDPLGSDILVSSLPDIDSDIFFHNLLSSKILFRPRANVYNNKFSKYILFEGGNILMNRYNVEENITLPPLITHLYYPKIPLTYNDSLIAYAIELNSGLIDLGLNKILNLDLNIVTNKMKTVETDNSASVCYFFNKYNRNNITQKAKSNNFLNTVNNTLTYPPYVVLIYNYLTNKIEVVLDRLVLPYSNVKAMFFDKTNKIFIVQSSDNLFTIYNTNTFNEIITLKGYVNHIDRNNNLIFNVVAFRDEEVEQYITTNGIFAYKIFYYSFNLNELLNRDINYPKEITENLNIDEFTNKETWNTLVNKYININLDNFSKSSKASSIYKNEERSIKYFSNKEVISGIENKILNYNRAIFSTNEPQNYKLDYVEYDIGSKHLTLQASGLEKALAKYFEKYQMDFKATLLGNEIKANFHSSNQSVIIEIYGINGEEAKKIKAGEINMQLFLQNKEINNIPNYENILVYENFNFIKNFLYYKKAGDFKELADKYFQRFVPKNTLSYNIWGLRVNNNDVILNMVKY